MAKNLPFAKIATVELSESAHFRADALTFVILTVEKFPVSSVWLNPGKQIPQSEISRLANRRSEGLGKPFDGSVSLVICTRDRPEELRRCLKGIAHQRRIPDEIIVVDNGSVSDLTRQVALENNTTYIREDRLGLDFARNSGARASKGEIVAYTDDDTELHPDWLQNLSSAFDSPEIMAVTGLVLPATLETEAQWLFEKAWSFGRGFERTDFGPEFFAATRRTGCPAWDIGAGANMAFRRTIFDEIGYFDERLDVGQAGCSGDSEFWYRILANGHTCRYEPTAVLFHHHRATMDGLKTQLRAYMRGHAAALLVQYERTGEKGNLRRLFFSLPQYYLRMIVDRLRKGDGPSNRMIGIQLSGLVAGILFYFRTPKPKS